MRLPTWIEPGRLIAGRHPCATTPAEAAGAVRALLDQGITLFVDLTTEGELDPYDGLIPPPVRSVRYPIRDFSVPEPALLTRVLDAIDDEIVAGGIVYVHCWAGCGRTGVIVGCWLVRHGAEPQDALALVARKRGPGCPQTLEQKAAILEWEEPRARTLRSH